jgi:hypothetical protein
MVDFANQKGFKLLTSTPYYAQANGQVEAANKVVINLIKKYTHAQPRNWHKTLNRILSACRRSFTSGNLCTISQSTKANGNSNRSVLEYDVG